jgi:hypothetical protein
MRTLLGAVHPAPAFGRQSGLLCNGFLWAGFLWAGLLCAGTARGQLASEEWLSSYRQAAAKWEPDIAKLETLNASESPVPESILFLGSSSIRLWKNVKSDMAPWPIIQRGYGGAKFSDLAIHVPRLLKGLEFRAALIFVGNDITGDQNDKSPEEVVRLFDSVVRSIRKARPHATIFLLAVTPTPKRFAVWTQIREANAALKKHCDALPACHFIATEQAYLTSDGQPRPELFVEDRLHQNEAGYQQWSKLIRGAFEKNLDSREP